MSNNKTLGEPQAIRGLHSEQLIALYEQRWSQVHHLDDLDRRSIVLVVTAITGAVAASQTVISFASGLGIALDLLALIICVGGIYSTIRNRVSMEYALSAIDFIESVLNERQVGLFPYAGNYRAPVDLSSFSRRVSFSIRGPIIMFFGTALVAIMLSIIFRIIPSFAPYLWLNVALPGVVSVASVSFFVRWCLNDNWNRGKSNFEMLNESREQPLPTEHRC